MDYLQKLRGVLAATLAEGADFALPSAVRTALAALASAAAGGSLASPPSGGEIPPALGPYADKVARDAYRVTDEDLDALRQSGMNEEAIFEATLATAVGAGVARMEAVLRALRAAAAPERI
jgi:alkylhydroperoxidase family enzyme